MFVLKGTFVDTSRIGQVRVLEDHLLGVDADGLIVHSESATSSPSRKFLEQHNIQPTIVPKGSLVLPTFCDLHLHAPQFLYQGNGLDLPLMEWLDKYTFKAEETLDTDPILAKKVYTRLARRLLENGTGAVSLFGTIKEDTNLILAEAMQSAGIRAFIGKLSMDISSRPTYIEPSSEASLFSAQSFVDRCLRSVSHLPPNKQFVKPVLTPRFVPTCSDELLKGLGDMSAKGSIRMQSHLAEAHDQVEWVRSTRGKEDIDIFDEFNLLTPRTLQAHCTFLSQPDLERLANTGTSIAHCPLSNIYFSTKPFPLREALDSNVKVGLGTDVAGGYSLDIMDAMRHAVAVSRMRQSARSVTQGPNHSGDQNSLAITWKEALYLATSGGAMALGLPSGSGTLDVGSPFDAQQIQLYDGDGNGTGALDFFDLDSDNDDVTLDMIEKWWCIGDNRNRTRVWVQGVEVFKQHTV